MDELYWFWLSKAFDMDAVNMSIKVAYSGKKFNRIQISYSTFEGTKVTLNYNFQ